MNTRIAATGLVILALVAGGFAFYLTTHRNGRAVTPPPSINITTNPPPSNNTQAPPKEATIYTVDEAHGDIDAAELLSAAGTLCATLTALASVAIIVLRLEPHIAWSWFALFGWIEEDDGLEGFRVPEALRIDRLPETGS